MLIYPLIIKIHSRQIISLNKFNIVNTFTISAAIYLSSLLTAIIQISPPSNAKNIGNISDAINQGNHFNLLQFIKSSQSVAVAIWRSYVPIPDFHAKNIWGSNIINANNRFLEIATLDLRTVAATFLSLILFLIFAFIFVHNRKVLSVYIIGTLLITLFGSIFKLPQIRHSGHLYILLIACFWIHLYELQQNRPNLHRYHIINLIHSYQNVFLTIILCVQLYAGIKMYTLDLFEPFSNSQNAAQFIKNNGLEKSTIIGSDYKVVSPISAWINRKIYYPETQEFGTFTVWTSKSISSDRDITDRDILRQAEKLSINYSDSLLLILDHKLSQTSTSLDIDFLASYKDSIVTQEKYFIYSIN